MPEIKNLFTSGKMNKDLDERLIPNNQYRDALNITVAHSEGSDVGAIENLLGNTKRINNSYNPDTGIYTQYNASSGTTDDFGFIISGAKTIGSVSDSKNEKLYWLVTSSTIDAIIEYDQSVDVVSPIIVDKNGVLGFSDSNLVTGINIIDGLLFFTDNNSEPKCININRFKEASASSTNGFQNHTEIYGRDFIEQDITVIKKSPLTAPLVETRSSKRLGLGVGINPLSVYMDLSGYESGDPLTLSLGYTPDYRIGDILLLTSTYSSSAGDIINYEITAQVVSGSSQFAFTNVTILSIPSELPAEILVWEVLLKEDDPMFQYKFPRFAYRWKYEDNQYSTFSPFTKAIFLADEFNYLSSDGYNIGMTNNIRFIKIYGLQVPPPDVTEIEILYKESNSNVIYSVNTVPLDNPELEIESELIHKVIDDTQILRPWDNVPRKAKAQEIIGNRIVYANYLQNFDVADNLETEFYINSADHNNIKSPEESIKSLRTYQLGVIWKDTYGRETPVFTSKESSVILGGYEANKINSLKARILSTPPPFATHFKYFIKETSNEYYNLALDRFYLDTDGNVWLSFPSAERNKVDANTYLYLKKEHNGDKAVNYTPKYKVLDIKNEAPNSISIFKKSIANAEVTALSTGNPDVDVASFEFTGPSAVDNPDFYSAFKSKNLISIKLGANITGDYEIALGGPTGVADKFKVTLSKVFKEDFLSAITNGTDFEIFIKEKVSESKAEFEGRFFVKISRDSYFNQNVIEPFNDITVNYGIIESAENIPTNIANTGPGDNTSYFGWLDNNASDSNWQGKIRRPQAMDNWFGVGFSGYAGGEDSPISTGYTTHPVLDTYLATPGTLVRFVNQTTGLKSEVYTIKSATVEYHRRGFDNILGNPRTLGSNARKQVKCVLDRIFEQGFGDATGIEILEEIISYNSDIISSNNPAIFETEPKETAELNIYYEASDAFPIADVATTKTLSWFNCYSFGNGVESDRIRDDFNEVRIGKGVKVSATLDEPYKEERRGSGHIFSQIYNSISGINRLNQFIQALPITKDLNPIYGTIQKLHARDTDLISLCEDKCFRILANKDALYNADGNVNITSNANVLGQAVPYVGEFGISKNPESFASYGFRAYFSDKNRGAVLRLSRDGLEEISGQGMKSYISNKLISNTTIIGSYDDYSDCYNISFSDETISYKDGLEGWPTRKSFVPDSGISLNNIYYTFKGSQIWSHDNEVRNNFYGTQYKSTVKLIFNAQPSNIKNFKALSYEGSAGWSTPSIQTGQQNGQVPSYLSKEGIYYNFIKGINETWSNTLQSGSISTSEFTTQGIDQVTSITGNTAQTEFTLTISENND